MQWISKSVSPFCYHFPGSLFLLSTYPSTLHGNWQLKGRVFDDIGYHIAHISAILNDILEWGPFESTSHAEVFLKTEKQ